MNKNTGVFRRYNAGAKIQTTAKMKDKIKDKSSSGRKKNVIAERFA